MSELDRLIAEQARDARSFRVFGVSVDAAYLEKRPERLLVTDPCHGTVRRVLESQVPLPEVQAGMASLSARVEAAVAAAHAPAAFVNSRPPTVRGASVSEPLVVPPTEAARLLSVSRDYFDVHVKPELRLIRRGRLVLVPVAELERWVRENAARAVE